MEKDSGSQDTSKLRICGVLFGIYLTDMDNKKLQLYFFLGLLLAVLVLVFALFRPFVAPIALAFMAAIIVKPVDRKILSAVKGRRTLAAVATTLFVILVILVPIGLLFQQIIVEAVQFYNDIREGGLGGFNQAISYVLEPIQRVFPGFDPDLRGAVTALADALVSNATKIFSSTASLVLGLFVAVLSLFYILRDGHRFRKAIVELSPLSDKYDTEIIDKVERAVNSVVRGSLFVALTQGVLATIGFFIFGVPHALLWGALAAVAALLPGIGTGLVVIPAVLYLVATGSYGFAIGLTIWGAVAIGLVDNIVLPVIVGRGFTVHPLLILLSVLGGLAFFGPIGLFLGPLVLALFFALIEIYKLLILDDKAKKTVSV